ncbi:DUF6056 family protein [Butyrivibrio fibrisolvens]|uniref:DUF6056 family protein n=1 Tax=Butyrivibrio fibrisolvens TaxID=831 RepID=UPI0003B38D5C|nr:DUF6056 family protein [Butyrivibrio fibrisolvens]
MIINKKLFRIVAFGVCIVLTAYMILTLVITSSYSVLSADDFSIGIIDKNTRGIQYLVAACDEVKHFYLNWQGTYSQIFIQSLLTPINHYGLAQLRWVMVFNSGCFFISLLFFIFNVIKIHKYKMDAIMMVVITSVVFSICGYETYPEIFFWFSGTTGYSIPFSMLMIGTVLYLKLDDVKQQKNKTIVAIILGFIAMGGSLTVAGTGCYFALIVLLYEMCCNRNVSKKKLLVFLCWLIGALVNALAPGNFVRHSSIDNTGIHIGKAITNSILITQDRWSTLLGYNFLLVLLVITVCGFVSSPRNKVSKKKALFSLMGLGTPFVTSFPLALGTETIVAPNRAAWVIDLVIILSSCYAAFLIGVYISNIIDKRRGFIIAIAVVLAFVICKYDGYGLSDFKTLELTTLGRQNVFKAHYNAHVRFYEWCMSQPGEDIVVTPEHCPYGIDNVFNLYLSNDPNSWVNKCVADYCGVKSIMTDYD